MTEAEFWNLIDSTRHRDGEKHADRLTVELGKRPPSDVLSFANWWYKFTDSAYSWDLWGAAYLINGGCSDDGFIDFRSWLILQGKQVYDAARANPDSLADLGVEEDDAQVECYPAVHAYEKATGKKDFYGDYAATYGESSGQPDLADGWDFDDEAEMRTRYPRLAEAYYDS
jgi:hypothetical protein